MGNIDDDTRSGILALDRLPEEPKAVLARARAIYLGDEQDRWDDVRDRSPLRRLRRRGDRTPHG
jgi:hypothetical protein